MDIHDAEQLAANYADRLAGVILGTAVGDALGLPREGLSRLRGARLFGSRPLRHHFLFGRGMVSDDTEHTCMAGQALLNSPQDADRFARCLAWKLRWWLLGGPAGIGRATLQSILRLWLGFSPRHSGVRSAGNGPAMRAAVLGACLGGDVERLRAYVGASTRLTHTEPRAERGAFLVALAARHGLERRPTDICGASFLDQACRLLPDADAELNQWLDKIHVHLGRGASAAELVEAMGLHRGVSGYIYHTVPIALYCWLRSAGDFRQALEQVINLGGDTDSTGAIVGGLVGATVGASGIPAEWLDGLIEWPRTVLWMRTLAARLALQFPATGECADQEALTLFWPGVPARNALFLLAVLLHIGRRMLPPY
jgi:ADP-ribosylglycohydrolase